MHRYFTIFLLILSTAVFGQTKLSVTATARKADSLYRVKDYLHATGYYLQLARVSDFKTKKAGSLYNAACCLALQNKTDSALNVLQAAIENGYSNMADLIKDTDFTSLHNDPGWKKLVTGFKAPEMLNDDPGKAEFITSDINRFWNAYDKAYRDTAHFGEIFKREYFDKASDGMNDYMGFKVSSIEYFVSHIRACPGYYRSIRNTTLKVNNFKKEIYASFKKFKYLYPPAKFPDVYFVIGAFTSGGTVSGNGLLIGVNQNVKTEDTFTGELTFRQRTRMNAFETLPNLIAHELIHFQQGGMVNDTITLGYVIREGMADFLAELISGKTPNTELYTWAVGKEKAIWNKFKADMFFNRYNNWIANSDQAATDNLPDQGYWIGYQVCKAYYEKATNKKEAIAAMLNIKDYRKFLEQSGWEEKLILINKK